MTHYRIYFYSTASALVIASIMYCFVMLIPHLYRADHYVVVFDPLIASAYSEKILDDIKKMNGSSPAAVFAKLQKKYAFLKSMQARYGVDGSLHVELVAFKPLLNVRDELVKLENGNYVPYSVFTYDSVSKISRYTICANDTLGALTSCDLTCYVDKIPDRIVQHYNILFTDAYEINLQDREKTSFLIRSSLEKLKNDNLYAQCEKIKEFYVHDGLLSSSDKIFWVADVRFDNQIVLYQQTVLVIS